MSPPSSFSENPSIARQRSSLPNALIQTPKSRKIRTFPRLSTLLLSTLVGESASRDSTGSRTPENSVEPVEQSEASRIRSFTDDFVRLALDPTTKKLIPDPDKTGKFVLLDSLVATTKSSEELRDQVLQILVAGRDTTSSLLSWTILLLSRHPKHLNFLRNAILEHFGTESSSKNAMTFSSLIACKPVQNVLYEALRLYPLVPVNSRTALVDTILPVGGGMDGKLPIAVAKGEQVVYSAYVLHRRNDIWGEDADEFRPGRWEGRRMGWEFLGFSGGPRVCLGREFTLLRYWLHWFYFCSRRNMNNDCS